MTRKDDISGLLKVFVLEDDAIDYEYLVDVLDSSSLVYKIQRATTLSSALSLIEEFLPDVIITDLNLPDSINLNTFSSLHKAFPEIPIIVTTGLDDNKLGKRAVRAGADDFISKSAINPTVLKYTIIHSIERNQLKSTQKILANQLEEANELKALLLDVISHDVISLSSGIYGLSSILNDENPKNRQFIALKNSSESLLKIIKNASILSRIAQGSDIPIEEVNLSQLFVEVVKKYQDQVSKKYRWELNIEDDVCCYCNAIVSEVLDNYLSNAIKYSGEEKKIHIELFRSDLKVILKVSDFGQTIDPEFRVSVFNKGFQMAGNHNRGSGLGLSIVKRIASALKAEVWVEPNHPKGNSFILSLNI